MAENDTIPAAAVGEEGGGADAPATLTSGELQILERHLKSNQRRRFTITQEERDKAVAAVRGVIENGKSQRAKLMAVRVLALLDAQSMRDEHHVEDVQQAAGMLDLQKLKLSRVDEGKANDRVAIDVTPVRELPLPEHLRGMRKRLLEPSQS